MKVLKKASVYDFHQHRAKKSVRQLEIAEPDFLKALSKVASREFDCIKRLGRVAAIFLILVITVSNSDGSALKINALSISVSIPDVYLLATASIVWTELLFTLLEYMNLLGIALAVRKRARETYTHPTPLLFLYGQKDVSNQHAFINGRIATIAYWPRMVLLGLHISLFLAIIFPLLAGLCMSVRVALLNLLQNSNVPFGSSLSLMAIIVFTSSTAFFAIYFIPFNILKNIEHTRWSFLSPMYSRRIHPEAAKWLDEKGHK